MKRRAYACLLTLVTSAIGFAWHDPALAQPAPPPPRNPSGIGDAPLTPLAPSRPPSRPPSPGVAPTEGARAAAPNPHRGLVVLEQNGRTLASGVVLDGDGRVVTGLRLEGEGALKSPEVVIRYGDNTRMRGKIRHADAAYGLALVVPLEGKRTEGLRASEAEPLRVPLHVMDAAQSKAATLEPFVARYLLASALPGILTLSEPSRTPAGTALIDESGAVAALTVRICGQAPAPATALPAPSSPASAPGWGPVTCDIPAVAPVSVLRGFLGRTPVDAVAPPPWLGIVGQPAQAAGDAVRGVRVVAVAAKSPAAVAGLRGNGDPAKSDVIIAVDGQPVASPEELGEKIATHAVGDKVKLQVLSGKTIRDLVVQLRAAP